MDTRVEQIFSEEMQGDTSFKSTPIQMFFGRRYTKREMRQTWETGIKYGIEIGLRRAGLSGQNIELNRNTTNNNHKEFLNKFYKLAEEYSCAIEYHPAKGMVVTSQSR